MNVKDFDENTASEKLVFLSVLYSLSLGVSNTKILAHSFAKSTRVIHTAKINGILEIN